MGPKLWLKERTITKFIDRETIDVSNISKIRLWYEIEIKFFKKRVGIIQAKSRKGLPFFSSIES